jgi:hypothetical protein
MEMGVGNGSMEINKEMGWHGRGLEGFGLFIPIYACVRACVRPIYTYTLTLSSPIYV